VFSDEIYDAPAAIALLEMVESECRHFGPPQAATQEHGQDGAVA
jgi:hypothetical protein